MSLFYSILVVALLALAAIFADSFVGFSQWPAKLTGMFAPPVPGAVAA